MLQQLYHIKEFSQALLEIDTSQIETSENIAYEVQKIFAYLKYQMVGLYNLGLMWHFYVRWTANWSENSNGYWLVFPITKWEGSKYKYHK